MSEEHKGGDAHATHDEGDSSHYSSVELAGSYEGEYQHGRFHGKGTYMLHGSRYEGGFSDGQFHGEGTLFVKNGYYQGLWRQGRLVDGGFIFGDGLQHRKVGYKYWDYCSRYDRRFYQEIKDGLPVGQRLREVTAHKHANDLPTGCYDTIDGYYDVKKHAVFSYTTNEVIRTPGHEEIDFILSHCRVGK